MALTQTLVRERFEREAALWNDIYESDTVEAAVYQDRQATVQRIVNQLELEPDARVLDIGCGAGWSAAALAGRGYRVHAVDLSTSMLTATRDRAEGRGVADRVQALGGDARALPLASGTFDAVVGIALLEWAAAGDVMREIARVLRPGGFALLTATNRWSLQRCLDPYLHPFVEPLKRAVRRRAREHAYSGTHSAGELRASLLQAELLPLYVTTTGYGPFTFFKYKLMSGARGAQLHHTLQRLADYGPKGALGRAGYAHIVLAQKSPL